MVTDNQTNARAFLQVAHVSKYICVLHYRAGNMPRLIRSLSLSTTNRLIVQAFYGQKLVNLPQIATEANSTDMIS